MDNMHKNWAPGRFVDQRKYSNWTADQKRQADEQEKLLVRPYPTENAICHCPTPAEAKWIASRLNLATTLEQMTYDYATGKTDGSEIIALVKSNIE